MTATDELRLMLDERGVEWRKTPHYSSESQDNETVFAGDGIEWYANDHLNGKLGLRVARYEVTPEQAIAATLGSSNCSNNCTNSERTGTCHIIVQDNMTETEGMGDVWLECDACGWQMPLEPSTPRFNYCPNCGRRVEQ